MIFCSQLEVTETPGRTLHHQDVILPLWLKGFALCEWSEAKSLYAMADEHLWGLGADEGFKRTGTGTEKQVAPFVTFDHACCLNDFHRS